MAKSIAVLMDAAAEVASVVAAVAVETEADVVDEIAMMVDLISPQKQPKIVGITQSPTADGITMPTILLIVGSVIGSRQQNLVIARNARAVVVAAEVVDATAMKDNGKTKRSPTATAMMRGATETTIAGAMTVHVMKEIAQAEANDLVEVAIVAHVAKAMVVMIVHLVTSDLPALRATIAVVVEGEGEAEAAVHADRMIRFQAFHDTAMCRLGTMRSPASSHPTSRAIVVDQEVARAADVGDRVPVEVGVETLTLEIIPVLTEAEETTLVQIEAEATTRVLTEVATRVPAEEILVVEDPGAIAAKERLEIRPQQGQFQRVLV